MGRKRKEGTEWLPPLCYEGRSAYEFRPTVNGKVQIIRLCALGTKQHVVWNRYEQEKRKLEMSSGTVEALFEEFFESPQCLKLAPGTIRQYRKNAKMLCKVFGHLQAKAVLPEWVREYMDTRGKDHEVTANRERAFMSRVYNWGYERGKVPMNPCDKVRTFSESARERYITDEEYKAVYDCATSLVKAVMEISYCCAARKSDVLGLTNKKLLDEGIKIKQGKTGKEQIKAWSPRLKAAIKLAKDSKATSFRFVICNTKGHKVTVDAFDYYWNKAKDEAARKNPSLDFDFTFHDIKAKSISDVEGTKAEKQKFSGHKTSAMVDTYDRKTEVVDTH